MWHTKGGAYDAINSGNKCCNSRSRAQQKGGDYLLAVKANQPTLAARAETALAAAVDTPFLVQTDSDRGRVEVRRLSVAAVERGGGGADGSGLCRGAAGGGGDGPEHAQEERGEHDADAAVCEQPGMGCEGSGGAGWGDSGALVGGEPEPSSAGRAVGRGPLSAARPQRGQCAGVAREAAVLAGAICGHWSVENQNHRRRDVQWGEDRCRLRDPNGASALALPRAALLALVKYQRSVPLLNSSATVIAHPDYGLQLLRSR